MIILEKLKQGFKAVVKWIVRGAIYIWFKVVYRVQINGLENIPKEGPLIILWKSPQLYRSTFDGQ